MSTAPITSDDQILDLLRAQGPLGVARLATETCVTPTAVRQRLTRLMTQGLIEREATRAGRGRPSHRYSLTEKGYRHAGSNFGDLAIALWNEVRAVRDPEIRKGLLQRIAQGMARMYGDSVSGETTAERMQSVADVFSNRDIPFVVDQSGELPVLTALACPYPELAEQDRGICAMERLLFSELLGRNVRLTECRLEGDTCCKFQPAEAVASG